MKVGENEKSKYWYVREIKDGFVAVRLDDGYTVINRNGEITQLPKPVDKHSKINITNGVFLNSIKDGIPITIINKKFNEGSE